jgi:diguanylate cyclase (GGDEF)-like protein
MVSVQYASARPTQWRQAVLCDWRVMDRPDNGVRRISRVFDNAVLGLGLVVLVGACVAVARSGWSESWFLLLTVPLLALISRYPLELDRHVGAIEIGFEASVLVFLLCVTSAAECIVLWSAGMIVSQLTSHRRAAAKRFNIGLGILAGSLAAAVFTLLNADRIDSPRELLAAAAACATYLVADELTSALSVALEDDVSTGRQLTQPYALVGAACSFGASMTGYLAALMERFLPWWSLLFLIAPLVAMLFANQAVTRGRENARRTSVLFDTSAQLHELPDAEQMQAALERGVEKLLWVPVAALRAHGPGAGEIGADLYDGQRERWLVTTARKHVLSNSTDDQRDLDALARVAERAFAKLRMTDEMTHMATHDILTGLPNRALFLDRVNHALANTRRKGTGLAVLFCDLDRFKNVNDQFGHAVGDTLLIDVAERLQTCLRQSDTVARLGGDEFAILLEDIDVREELATACERILSAVREPIDIAGTSRAVSTSIGVSLSGREDSGDTLLRFADVAMYQAKLKGRNRYEVYRSAFGDARVEKLELAESLRRAVQQRDLSLAYQPVVDVRTRQITGVETLARWSLDGRPISPEKFIAVAEEHGLVVQLGGLVLDLMAADAPRLAAAFGPGLTIGVNISAQQLASAAFVDSVQKARRRMAGANLLLEVTERAFVGNDATTLSVMTALADLGVEFAVDDFGIGYASIDHLQKLPVKVLKTDRLFSAKIDTDETACHLLHSMVAMGQALGLDVVVEGIERQSQVEHLIEHVDGTLAQGYLLHKPMGVDALCAILRGQARVKPAAAQPPTTA